MKKVYKRKLKLKKKVLFNLIQFAVIALSIALMVASFKEGNWRHNGGVFFLEMYLVLGVMMMEDFVK